MAATQFGTSDPLTIKKWSKDTFKYALKDFWFLQAGFMGMDQNSIIQVLTDLEVPQAGDAVTIHMDIPLSGAGVGDGGNVLGSEEALKRHNQTVTIHERAWGVVAQSGLDIKRVLGSPDAFRTLAKNALGEWWRNMCLEPDIEAAIFGLYNTSGISTVNELYPSATRIIYGGQTVAGAVSAAAMTTDALLSAEVTGTVLCGLKFMEKVRRAAIMATPKIRPIKTDVVKRPIFVILLSPYHIKSIRQETGEHSFTAMMKDAEVRGKDNPLFGAAKFLYDDMLFIEYDRAPIRTGAGGSTPAEGFLLHANKLTTTDPVADTKTVARGVLLGAQAGLLGWGMKPLWSESYADERKTRPRVIVEGQYVTSKVRFNEYTQPSGGNTAQADYGVLAFDTQVQLDS